jgi:murein DD-endopeptidase MepM/ murein hydrolase activator NlpD
MDKKFYTFLVFPGAHGNLHKIRLPFYIVHMVLAFSVVGIMTIAALANSYARMLLKVSNYNSLRTEREALKTQNQTLENAVTKTNAKLDSLQSLAKEVALTYGFGEAHRPRFPEAALALATQTNSTVESSYRASLYAFNLIRNASSVPTKGSSAVGFLPSSELGHSTVPSIWPLRGQITAGFGQRLDPFSGEGVFHSGVDICAHFGTRVEAPADGIVLQAGAGVESGYGNAIVVDHGYGMTTKYGHLSKIFVVVGQEVKRGQVIGAVGMTGKTTGPHLHYEVIVNDTPVNPMKYLHE